MNRIYTLLMLVVMPSVMFSMEEVQNKHEKFVKALFDPTKEKEQADIKEMVRNNPDYATLIHGQSGCSPLWTLVCSYIDGEKTWGQLDRAKYVDEVLSDEDKSTENKLTERDPIDVYKDLFVFFLNEGAEIDFSNSPQSLNLSEEDVPQVVRDVHFDFQWRKARKTLVGCEGDALVEYLKKYPVLLDTPNTDNGSTLLHEAAYALDKDRPETFGMFRLLLRKGADYTVGNSKGNTVEAIMSKDAEELSIGADLFEYQIKLLEEQNNLPKGHDWQDMIPTKKVKGLLSGMYNQVLPFKEYVLGVGGLLVVGYFMFGGSTPEAVNINEKILI